MIYVRWTRQGSTVVGSLQQVQASGRADDPIKTDNMSFEGNISGTGISLTFRELGSIRNWTGTIDADLLTIEIPQPDGTIATDRLVPATPAEFNAEVESLRARLADDAAAAADQAAELLAAQQAADQEVAERQAAVSAAHALAVRYRDLAEIADSQANVLAGLEAAMVKYKQNVAATQLALDAETSYAQTPGADCYKVNELLYALNEGLYSVNEAQYSYGEADAKAVTFIADVKRAQQGLREAQANFDREASHNEEPPVAPKDVIGELQRVTKTLADVEAKQATTKASAAAYDKQAKDKVQVGTRISTACEQPIPTSS